MFDLCKRFVVAVESIAASVSIFAEAAVIGAKESGVVLGSGGVQPPCEPDAAAPETPAEKPKAAGRPKKDKAARDEAPAKTPEVKITMEEVRAVLGAFVKSHPAGTDAAKVEVKKVIQEVGKAPLLDQVDPANYGALIEAVKALDTQAAAPAPASDEDF